MTGIGKLRKNIRLKQGFSCINRRVSRMYRIITNNSLCRDKYGKELPVEYLDGKKYMDVLLTVRDYIQKGWRLETHPMTGSLKPNQTPYKSIMISNLPVDSEEFYSQEITIENSIAACRKFLSIRETPDWPEHLREDYRIVDLSLIEGAIQKVL